MRQKAGRVTVAGLALECVFEPVEGLLNDRIDAAYGEKYVNSPYLPPMVGPGSRAATMKIVPR